MGEPRLIKHFNDYDLYLRKAKVKFEHRYNKEFVENAKLDDFILLRTLGAGAFGRVILVKHKAKPGVAYAMKLMEKANIVKTKQVAHTMSEIRILDAVKFDFLVGLEFFFKDNVYLFITMQFINGGEMFTHLRTVRKFDEETAKFYGAQVCLAFEYLHYLGLIYRDLKPENILIDKDGYLKITDYGFCKKVDDARTYTLCGTPEYLAPEVILSQGYNKSVDWWTFGILIFEMTAGYTPFFANDPMKLYEKIVNGKFNFPGHFTKPLKDLVYNILQVDRTKRFGMMKDGSKDIKAHEWFRSLDWENVLMRRVKPSYKPKLTGADDASNFDKYDEEPLRKASKNEYPNEFCKIAVK
ncbi:cAMP-dependent protein kinase catalytic subunit beta-like [Ctenocephalides felis]|uniref:cAMP-dependent protein kinase catalytic subunit beta-like n=1 Tax=Ctenocephalides felis TaxID=7515 RepID=UPI000E6E2F4E|nr:cAMP-dependent protein kinase catalytic subunit beta-like [Ctenocephalides felis]